eukprot:4032422-Pleurochrysis_carterae.AAC.1
MHHMLNGYNYKTQSKQKVPTGANVEKSLRPPAKTHKQTWESTPQMQEEECSSNHMLRSLEIGQIQPLQPTVFSSIKPPGENSCMMSLVRQSGERHVVAVREFGTVDVEGAMSRPRSPNTLNEEGDARPVGIVSERM